MVDVPVITEITFSFTVKIHITINISCFKQSKVMTDQEIDHNHKIEEFFYEPANQEIVVNLARFLQDSIAITAITAIITVAVVAAAAVVKVFINDWTQAKIL